MRGILSRSSILSRTASPPVFHKLNSMPKNYHQSFKIKEAGSSISMGCDRPFGMMLLPAFLIL